MRTYEHALISVGYGAIISLLAGKGYLDPGIYLATLIGGELIDLIDHPIYLLIFRRNDPEVREAREEFLRGNIQAAWQSLKHSEDQRKFNNLLLHNVFALSLFVYTAIFTSLFLPGDVYSFAMLGAFLLHMLTDIYGDFKLLGHADNWLWIFPGKLLKWLGGLGPKLVWIASLWWVNVIFGFFLVTFRWGWQLYLQPGEHSTTWILVHQWTLAQGAQSLAAQSLAAQNPAAQSLAQKLAPLLDNVWLAYGPLVLLMLYFAALNLLIAAGVHKLNLEVHKDHKKVHSRFSTGSLGFIKNICTGKVPAGEHKLEKLILLMQSDQEVWILILTGLISTLLLVETWLKLNNPTVIILTAIIPALTFGTLIHTTIGELGGVQGALLATFLHMVLSRLSWQDPWPVSYGYMLFAAALGAWLLGLLGAIILRGSKRMSLSVFVFQIHTDGKYKKDDAWLQHTAIIQKGLMNGYQRVHEMLFGEVTRPLNVHEPQIDYVVVPQEGRPTFSGGYYHLTIQDSTVPLLQDMAYVLCDNALVSQAHHIGKYGLLPVMPRYRIKVDGHDHADLVWNGGYFQWENDRHPFPPVSLENPQSWLGTGEQLALHKTWGEFYDNMVTRRTTFHTDLYVFLDPDDPCAMTVCGLTRTATNTKEYTTLESEAYCKAVLDGILEEAHKIPGIRTTGRSSARIYYPRLSFDDQAIVKDISQSAVFPTSANDCFSIKSADLLNQALEVSPVKNQVKHATADLGQRIIVLVVEVVFAFITTYITKRLGLN